MSDYISRTAVLDLWDKYHPTIATCAMSYDKALRALPSAQPQERAIVNIKIPDEKLQEAAEIAMKGIIAAQPQPNWIPCSERLPEEGTEVLTYNHDDDYAINHIIDGEEWFFDGAVAWMPLPEPYKED